MGLLAAGSKRVGSVVAQGKDAVSQAKGAAQEDKQPSIGKEKSQGFYYDKARNRWVIEGEEPAEPPPPPPPPPTILGPQTGMRSRYVDPLFSGSAQPPEQAAPPSCLLPVPPQGNTPAAPLSTFYVPSAPTNFKEGITEGSSSGGDHSNEISALGPYKVAAFIQKHCYVCTALHTFCATCKRGPLIERQHVRAQILRKTLINRLVVL
ncbi:hypothetical protein DUNSADRAFT_12588 [Dunaliella salina]|uniref:Uncharacterized protein n=1 Tax=Dunaliella salina TaxID=3046 RepID=A0ABQ7GAZ5_DUNSA|nr:hypothetical protein DUNSADRAFT_12588 [Dunaliella salina]|eukprot:KAF5831777.1 hypothetical protein DUNSADRAFT_12588 [Dunaliella salina]